MAIDYSWVTQEAFDKKLEELVKNDNLLSIPGVYEIVAEHYNNAVLKALEDERDNED